MNERPTRTELVELCETCHGVTNADPCAGERTHDEGFERCDCEEPER